ncbi:hypothetical protein [Macrococcoides caseolyticum]|uniref:Uncharacterized protein n=1 Tax=Macrococcoides caseolyticum TaxID=69966 RepID=A0ACC9MQW5_9STAP|nr:hypothetical protein [Macrococcus caseolyticus]PKE38247.1 hypothetical protein CW675_11825 [Macrococcus caseolyticus]PKE55396.1 hypothetical protein CW682_12100 [Macrococcus caseolyticus]
MKNLIKVLICAIVFSVTTSFTTSGFVEASENQPTEQEIKNDKYIYEFTEEDYSSFFILFLSVKIKLKNANRNDINSIVPKDISDIPK